MAARKTTKRPEAKAPGRVKVNITLPHEQETMLGVLAAVRRVNKSALISEALKPMLAGYYVTRRGNGGSPDPTEGPTSDLQAA